MSVIVAGVGYSHLRDLSVGPVVAAELQAEPWPEHIRVEDWSYGPVSVVHRMNDPQPPVSRVVVFGAIDRGVPAGTVQAYRWDGALPAEDMVQARVAEAVTGVVSLDNLVIVTAQFAALPPEVFIVEVQPEAEEFGLTFSAPVAAAIPEVKRAVRSLAEGSIDLRRVPVAGLGAGVASGHV